MANTITPTTFTTTTVVSPQALLITHSVRGQIDLRGVFGAMLNLIVARISTTTYTNPVDIIINRLLGTIAGSGANLYASAKSLYNLGRSSALAASSTVTTQVNTTNSAADETISIKTVNLATYGTLMAFLGSTAPGSLTNGQAVTTLEVARTSGFTGTGPWTHTLSGPLGIVHGANDYVTSAPDVWDIWLPGGYVYDVTFDAYNISTGAGAVVQAVAQVYPSDTVS